MVRSCRGPPLVLREPRQLAVISAKCCSLGAPSVDTARATASPPARTSEILAPSRDARAAAHPRAAGSASSRAASSAAHRARRSMATRAGSAETYGWPSLRRRRRHPTPSAVAAERPRSREWWILRVTLPRVRASPARRWTATYCALRSEDLYFRTRCSPVRNPSTSGTP